MLQKCVPICIMRFENWYMAGSSYVCPPIPLPKKAITSLS